MKNKTVGLLLPIAFLGYLITIFVAITTGARESSRNTSPLNEVWTFQADGRVLATPILIDDQIIFRTKHKIFSISAVDGSKYWEITASASNMMLNTKPLVGNSKFLISEEQNDSISVYSTKSGERLWFIGHQPNSINTPVELVDDIMVVATHDGDLAVYDLTSQHELWKVALPMRVPTPIAANSDLVISGAENVLRVYNLKDGHLLNEKSFGELDKSFVVEILLSESNIFVSSASNGNYSISSLQLDTLKENWVFYAGKEISHPYLSGTIAHLSLFNQNMILLDTNDGNDIWRDFGEQSYSSPAFHEDNMFFIFVDSNRKLCKVEIKEGAIKDCFVVDNIGNLFQSYVPGPLATSDLLILPRGSDVVALTMP